MKMNFGFRFVLATAMSLSLALALIYYNITRQHQFDLLGYGLHSTSSMLAIVLIILGYYRGFNTVLKTRVSPFTYLNYVVIGIGLCFLTVEHLLNVIHEIGAFGYIPLKGLIWTLLIPLGIAFLPPYIIYQTEKTKEHPLYRQWFEEGKGGSARWASVGTYDGLKEKFKQNVMSFWFDKRGIRTDGLYLGRTIFDDDPFRRHILLKDDAHMMTIGLSGSGKTTTVLNHVCSTYESSLICLDIKAELSRATANRLMSST